VEQLGDRSGMAVDGDRPERKIQFKAKITHRMCDRLGEEFDDAGRLR